MKPVHPDTRQLLQWARAVSVMNEEPWIAAAIDKLIPPFVPVARTPEQAGLELEAPEGK